jgi:hypothetical protein
LREKSVIARTIEAAGGVYAPGDLGELTQIVDFVLVDTVIEETGSREKRLRLLPARVVVYFVLALALFEDCSYRGVVGQVDGGAGGTAVGASGGLLAVQGPAANRSGTAAAAVRDPRRTRRPPRAGRFVLSRASDGGRGRHLAARAR